MTEKQTMSVAECAKALGISRNLCYQLCRQGKIKGAIELGEKRIVISRPMFEKFLNGE